MFKRPAALLFALTLSAGCVAPGGGEARSDRLDRARADVRLAPLLGNSRVTLVERDGTLVFGGSVDSLQDLNVIRDIASDMEDEGAVENAVVYLGGDDEDAGDDET